MSVRAGGSDLKTLHYQSGEVGNDRQRDAIDATEDRKILGLQHHAEINWNSTIQLVFMDTWLGSSRPSGRSGPSFWDNEYFMFRTQHGVMTDDTNGNGYIIDPNEMQFYGDDGPVWSEDQTLEVEINETQGNDPVTGVWNIYYREL